MADDQHRQRVECCRQAYGFWLDPGPGGQLYLFVPYGQDPTDGAPLQLARQAWPHEADLWRRGRLADLARLLRNQGLPVNERHGRAWSRFLEIVRRSLGMAN